MDHWPRVPRPPDLRVFAVDEQALLNAVTHALKQRCLVKEDRKLGRAAIFCPHLSGGHLAFHLETGLIPDESRGVRNVPPFEELLLLMQDALYLVLAVAG